MHLEKLSLINFKNYEEAELKLKPGVIAFLGNNGSGKTNLLDAIHYLSFCKSYFNPIDSQNIRFEQDFFMIQGTFDRKGQKEEIYCGIKKRTKKVFKRNKKEYDRLADHIGLFPSVMITPYDTKLISDGSEERRKLMDAIISQLDRTYLNKLIQYNKALSQRNSLLKNFAKTGNFQWDVLEVWNQQLTGFGSHVHEIRKAFIDRFNPIFNRYYNKLSSKAESVSLEYQSQLNEDDLENLLPKFLDKDRILQYTSVGIHRDDLNFTIAGYPLKKFGSQGQQKSYLIALKLAQLELLKEELTVAPILLLDDIFDKLDDERISQLLKISLEKIESQVFISDTSLNKVPEIIQTNGGEIQVFEIKNGRINEKKK